MNKPDIDQRLLHPIVVAHPTVPNTKGGMMQVVRVGGLCVISFSFALNVNLAAGQLILSLTGDYEPLANTNSFWGGSTIYVDTSGLKTNVAVTAGSFMTNSIVYPANNA